ncbi:MAG: hypothetical protein GY790_17410 [Bacteroidetes bacterium]|nr:hypothetical protein [Bacteroidota bacterium]
MKMFSLYITVMFMLILASSCKIRTEIDSKEDLSRGDYCVACYYQPFYHQDPRAVREYGMGWTGWEVLENYRSQSEGNLQPGIPMWDYTDDSNPRDMELKIDAAADHGVDVFIFDWYYNNDGPFLQGAIEQGYFPARNNDRMKFALVWMNQDLMDLSGADKDQMLHGEGQDVFFQSLISSQTWDEMTDYIVNRYFKHSSYWSLNEAPYFSIFDLSNFLESFGSIDKAKGAIEILRNKAKKAGFKDVQLNLVQRGSCVLPSGKRVEERKWMKLIAEMGFTSTSTFSWTEIEEGDKQILSYDELKEAYFTYVEETVDGKSLPYFPSMTMGWNSFRGRGQASDNTPEKFRVALNEMKLLLDKHPSCNNTLIINSWNDWIKGCYLEPDTTNGMAYLEALRMVFKNDQLGQYTTETK